VAVMEVVAAFVPSPEEKEKSSALDKWIIFLL
jgi:hypothetical protein